MNDTIVQEVRDIRAAIAAEFGYDRTRIIAWAREQTRQRKEAIRKSSPNAPHPGVAVAAKSPMAH